MASTVFRNLSPQGATSNQTETTTANNIVNQILGSVNPKETFDQMISGNKDAQKAMGIVQQYGNGDAKTAFMNYAQQMGKGALAQSIMKKLGLQ